MTLPTRHEVCVERLAILDQQIDSLRATLASRAGADLDQALSALELTLATLIQSRSVYAKTLVEFERARPARTPSEEYALAQRSAAVPGSTDGMAVLRRVAELHATPGADPDECLHVLVDAGMALTGAPRAMLRLHDDKTGTLRIAAQRGFEESFLSIFDVLDAGAGTERHRTLQAGARVVVVNVDAMPGLPDDMTRQALVEAGVRAVMFVPLMDGDRGLVGALSMHFPAPHVPDGESLSALDFLARLATAFLAGSRTQQALEAAALQLTQTFENAAVGLARCTRDLRFVAANAAYARLNGLPRGNIVGRGIVDLMGAEAFEAIRLHVERVLQGTWVEYEIEVAVSAKGSRWLRVTNAPWREGTEVVGWLATVSDVTERRLAQDELRAANRRYDGLLELLARTQLELDQVKRHLTADVIELETLYLTAQVGLTSFDRELRCTRISQRMAEINGVPVDASLGRHLREYIPGPLADHAEPLLRRVMDTGVPIVGMEVTGETKAGVQRNWRVNYSPVRASDGQVAGVAVAVLDVTD